MRTPNDNCSLFADFLVIVFLLMFVECVDTSRVSQYVMQSSSSRASA